MKYAAKLIIILLLLQTIPLQIRASAGILPYVFKDGLVWFFLGQDGGGDWADFGGFGEKRETRKQSAIREFSEETKYVYGKNALRLPPVPEADLKKIKKASADYIEPRITHEITHPKGYYSLFLANVDYIPASIFQQAFKTPDYDKVAYRWVPAQDLLDAMQGADRYNAFYNDMKIRRQLVDTLQDVPIQRALNEINAKFLGKSKPKKVVHRQALEPIEEPQKPERAEEYDFQYKEQILKIQSVSVLPCAYVEGRILFLLAGEVRGRNNQLMYGSFGTSVNQSAFIRGFFDPLIIAGYGFKQTIRDIYGPESEEYIKHAIRKTGKIAFYDQTIKHMMYLAEIDYISINPANNPCLWVYADEFLTWVNRNTFVIEDFDNPVKYGSVNIYQPFAAIFKTFMEPIAKKINEIMTKKQQLQKKQVPAPKVSTEAFEQELALLSQKLMALEVQLRIY